MYFENLGKSKREILKAFRDAVDDAVGVAGSRTNHDGAHDPDELAQARSNMAELAQAYVAAAKDVRKTTTKGALDTDITVDTIGAFGEMESELVNALDCTKVTLMMSSKPENAARARSNIAELTQARVAVAREERKTIKTIKAAQPETQQPKQDRFTQLPLGPQGH
jgi:hypothetical protein